MNTTSVSVFNIRSVIGTALILIGTALLLDQIGLMYFSWKKVFWIFGLAVGVALALQGFILEKRRRVFWGSLLFFVSLHYILWSWGLVDRDYLLWLPSMCVALGLAYFVLYLYEPTNFTLLLPSSIFIGIGVVSVLWWWEYLEWFEVEDALRTYWPLALVAWGVALLVRRR
jgi:hypothetical protein